jgi:hypothetical protein
MRGIAESVSDTPYINDAVRAAGMFRSTRFVSTFGCGRMWTGPVSSLKIPNPKIECCTNFKRHPLPERDQIDLGKLFTGSGR